MTASADSSDRVAPPVRAGLGTRALNRWRALRDRLLASKRFHRLAAALPITRPLARRRARALYDVVAGFVYSQVLAACVRLDLFERLAEGPRTAETLAPRLGLTPEATRTLLDAACSLRLVERRGPDAAGRTLFGLGDLGGALRGADGVAEMVAHHALLYADLADPVALLKGERDATRTGAYWAYAGAEQPAALDDATTRPYSALMAASQPLVAEEVLDSYRLRRHRRLLDIGGGEGVFVAAALRRAPGLRATVFDLPSVAARARERLAAQGLSDRAEAVGGSFFDDPLPSGADLVTLVRVLYDHPDDAALTILRAARRAVAPGGALLVAEPMADTPGAEPIGAAYFGFYLLAMGGGRSRSPARLAELIAAAGFANPRLLPTRRPLLARAMVADAR